MPESAQPTEPGRVTDSAAPGVMVDGPDEGKWLRTKRGRVRHLIRRHSTAGSERRIGACGAEVFIERRILDSEPDYINEAASDFYPRCAHCEATVDA